MFAVYINGTQPVTLAVGADNKSVEGGTNPNTAPVSPFPYTRLASIGIDSGATRYLYHQINGTTIAEEQYLRRENQWFPSSYIIIPGA